MKSNLSSSLLFSALTIASLVCTNVAIAQPAGANGPNPSQPQPPTPGAPPSASPGVPAAPVAPTAPTVAPPAPAPPATSPSQAQPLAPMAPTPTSVGGAAGTNTQPVATENTSQANDSTASSSRPTRPAPPEMFDASVGLRTQWVQHKGFEPFTSNNNVLSASAIQLTYRPLFRAPFGVSVGVDWDAGNSSGSVRNRSTELSIHRLSAVVRAEYQVLAPWRFYLRAAPGAQANIAQLHDNDLGVDQRRSAWTWSVDASIGTIVRVLTMPTSSRPVYSHFFAEFGYSFAGETSMRMTPQLDADDTRTITGVTLPNMSTRGYTLNVGLLLSL